jgi:hypothetical protein
MGTRKKTKRLLKPSGVQAEVLSELSPAILEQALGNLLEVLARKGAPDPANLNRQILSSTRGTEANVAAIEEQMARSGLTGAIPLQALIAAARTSGQGQINDLQARETARGEDRNMQAINMLNLLFGGASQQAQAGLGFQQSADARSAMNKQAALGALSALTGGLSPLAGMGGGGGVAPPPPNPFIGGGSF